jgi:CelD/BcsL family acetyltransferase involved in cellulose biosynthesis
MDLARHAPVPADVAATFAGPVLQARAWADCQTADFVAQWDALALAATQPNPFYESWYLLPSLRALDPAGHAELLVLEDRGALLGLLPVCRPRQYYGHRVPHLRNWVHDNCFCGQPLVAPGLEAAFWRALLQWCDGHAGIGLFLHLRQMPGDGPLHQALKSELARQHRPAATVLAEERALLCSDLSAEDYLLAAIGAKKRKELRRQHRRLGEEGALTVERTRAADGIATWTAAFLALEKCGWKGRAGSALADHPANAILFAEALVGAAARGRLERLSLHLDGTPIAMLATFITPPGAYSFKTAFDEDYARFSPGVLLQCENLALAGDPDIAWIDSCAAPDHAMIDHVWRERRPMAHHSIAIGGTLRQTLFTLLAQRETGKKPRGLS